MGETRQGRAEEAGQLVLAGLNKTLGRSQGWQTSKKVYGMWHAVSCGEEYAAIRKHVTSVMVTQPHKNSKFKELIMFVDSNIWMFEFNMHKTDIMRDWNIRCVGNWADIAVDKVTFRLARRAREEGQSAALAPKKGEEQAPIPLTSKEKEEVGRQTAVITDKTLRRHAQNAMIASLEWKKTKN